MTDAFCGFPPTPADRWPSMSQMNCGTPLALSAASLGSRQSIQTTLTSPTSGLGNPASHMGFGNSLSMGCMTSMSGMGGMSSGSPPTSAYNSAYNMVAPPHHPGPPTSLCNSGGGGGMGGLSGGSPSPTLPCPSLPCGLSDVEDSWRGSSIAALRRKAIEHTVHIGGYR